MRKTKVYIASPYTKGDVAVNVKRQLDMFDQLMTLGYAPHAPLYSHFQHMAHPRPYTDWIAIDLEWVAVCDVLLRLAGESSGADGEVDFAIENGVPVVFSVEELLSRFPAAQETAASRATEWQDIETAPKDGTAIVLCWAINADGKPIDWRKDPSTAGVFVQVASWWAGDNDWIVYCSMPHEPSLHFKPTHWMPLPNPPEPGP